MPDLLGKDIPSSSNALNVVMDRWNFLHLASQAADQRAKYFLGFL